MKMFLGQKGKGALGGLMQQAVASPQQGNSGNAQKQPVPVFGGDYWDGGGNSFGYTTISGAGTGWRGYVDPKRREDTFYYAHFSTCKNRPDDYYCKMEAWQKKNPFVVALTARAGGGLRGFENEQQAQAWMDANPDAVQSWSYNGMHVPKVRG